MVNIGIFALTGSAITSTILLNSKWKSLCYRLIKERDLEKRINELNTKALDYIANNYPGLVNEAFANIDREEENENV